MAYDFIYPLFSMFEKKNKEEDSLSRSAMNLVTLKEAQYLNETGHGIFWCVNMDIKAKERIASNLDNVDIKYQYVDLDKGDRTEQWSKIIESPLIPSLVVETHNGFHLYWKTVYESKDVPTFKEIQKRLIEYYDGDKACKDVLRVLRCPCFKQWKHFYKDNAPYEVETIFTTDFSYSDTDFLSTFLQSEDETRISLNPDKKAFMNFRENNSLTWSLSWDKLCRIDQKELLMRLSGTEYVNRETYTFFPNSNGTEQIVINGISTSCFIRGGQIVADKGYGNNIFNWLRWKEYNNSDKDIIGILKHMVPEIFN